MPIKPGLRLSDRSRKRAKGKRSRWYLRYRVSLAFFFIAWGCALYGPSRTLACRILATKLSVLCHSLPEWDGLNWAIFLAAAAVVLGGIMPLYEYLHSQELAQYDTVVEAGSVPTYNTDIGEKDRVDQKWTNAELYTHYYERAISKKGFLIPNLPIYFVVLPRAPFDVVVTNWDGSRFTDKVLSRDAASAGFDWYGYKKWCESEWRRQYFDKVSDVDLRVTSLSAAKQDGRRVELTGAPCEYSAYLLTESAFDRVTSNQIPALRPFFEGESYWSKGKPYIDLDNITAAAERFSMVISVCMLVTTADGFLVLQRQSRQVRTAAGGVAASATGAAQWKDTRRSKGGRLVESALRELHEELHINRNVLELETLEHPFMGAAFNLRYGRDLNFYAHFHLRDWSYETVARNRFSAVSRWEVAHLLFVPVSKIGEDGILAEPFQTVIGEARHLRGALYAFAKSGRLKQIQQRTAAANT